MQSSKKPRFYLPQLDALRFFAFACVFLLHALPARLMTLREPFAFGLSLFFFLSAYLITSLLKIEAEATGTVNLKGFYIRRILRIWPLYFLFVGALAIAGIHWPEAHFEPGRVVAMGLLYGNWYFILNGMGSPLASQLWSICVEEQFYAVWPSVFKALPAALFLRVTMAIAAGSLVSVFLLASTGSSTLGIWLNTLPQAVFFATGAALAFKMDFNQRANVRLSALMIAAGCCCWVLADILGITKLPTHTHPWRMTAGYAVVALGCGLLLIGALKFPASRVPRWSIYLGKISYGLYVFHALVLNLIPETFGPYLSRLPGLSIVVILGVTVLIAAASYKWIETPFLRLKNRFETVKTRAV